MKKVALFPGSFDPFTKGHADIALRAAQIFDEVIITIGYNSKKQNRLFDVDYMITKIGEAFEGQDNIKAISYNELTANLAQKLDAKYLVRGLRNTTDFEYENSISQINRRIYPDLETVFIITDPKFAYISSTVIREIYRYGQNINEFLPYNI
ncbi:pantetheine-phosphate adenylyltransferase [Chondrinema litorale]|uniref:pantetheine-phosphate adenylyltransferase n=1 Tax=Chondrinema litorale TaxID=2994555 RepID=UPI002543B47B|nr:pantetheine-phosphate adenylyltransferase [Chondrinema litorale]UZR95160.1 pantetheine-phosphate adenylyltransferase [Chondrinema litorale]